MDGCDALACVSVAHLWFGSAWYTAIFCGMKNICQCFNGFCLLPLMNGVRGAGFLTASVNSSIAAVILPSNDVLGIVTFVGKNSIVSDTLLPPVVV